MILNKVMDMCAERGISVYRLEHDLKFSNGTIRKWGGANPRADKLKAVANYFGVTVDDLLKEDANAQ